VIYVLLSEAGVGTLTMAGTTDGGNRYRQMADQLLGAEGDVVHVIWEPGATIAERERLLDDALAECDAVVVTPWLGGSRARLIPTFDRSRLQSAPRLKVIAGTFDHRLDWLDFAAAGEAGLVVVDTSRTMTPTVAEFGVAMTLNLLRNIPAAIDLVRRGEWMERSMAGSGYVFGDIGDFRIGLAGFGSINRYYRDFVRPFGPAVTAYDPYLPDDVFAANDVERVDSLVELAASSDIFVVGIPPTPATLEVVDAAAIDALPQGAGFVLLSRMAVVEQDPLWRRLRAGEIAAALDVFDPEPPPSDAWFRTAPNVLSTPHLAGNTVYAHERCFAEACRDAITVVGGGEARNRATPRDKAVYDGTVALSN
jgi:D-3-phosphoglycerate dehydrogenase